MIWHSESEAYLPGILVILFLLSLYMRWRENSRKVKEKTGKKKMISIAY